MTKQVKIAVVMGSSSDWEQMRHCCDFLDQLDLPYDKQVISAHRMPEKMMQFAQGAKDKGYQVIIAGAGGAAHLPGMIASSTILPVIGIPIKSSSLNGIDSLLSIVQMPAGVPVSTMAIGPAGAKNAALMAARIIALNDKTVAESLISFHRNQHQAAIESSVDINV
ncbi:5-(carboxyamino)imidazole ribonucleotide mutase [Aerococcaceae bacterium WGS1372]